MLQPTESYENGSILALPLHVRLKNIDKSTSAVQKPNAKYKEALMCYSFKNAF